MRQQLVALALCIAGCVEGRLEAPTAGAAGSMGQPQAGGAADEPSPGGRSGGPPVPNGPPDPTNPNAPPPPLAEADPRFEPAPGVLHRLTRAEFVNTLYDLFGPDVPVPQDLETDTPLHGFSTIGATDLTVSPRAAEQLEAAAVLVSEFVMLDAARRSAFLGCEPLTIAEPCVRTAFERFGRRAWRRPLLPPELDAILALMTDLEGQLRDVPLSLVSGLSALLQSPDFVYRVELGLPDPANPTRRRYEGFEMASRLSYFLWLSPPDEVLLDAAARGELSTEAGVRAAASRMVADAKAERGLAHFFSEYLSLDRLDGLQKDPATFPQMSGTLARSMRTEIEKVFGDVAFVRDADFRELLTTRRTFIDGELAALYGLDGPADSQAFSAVDLPGNHPRGGLLGMAGVLSMHAHHTVTSPTLRGKFIQASLLCFDIPPPPPGIPNLEDGPAGQQTMRQKLERHRADPTCNGCHQYMDPLGLALEHFDAIGAYRTTDQGLPIDARGDLDGVSFNGPTQLGHVLADHPDLGACLVRRMYRYATGHLEGRGEEPALLELSWKLGQAGHRVKALAVELAASPGFRLASTPEP